ncbi:hypothetical protein PR048_012290 [Dryococelus australis]|uniref:Tc1-like transposase DDE domain-containing protein n=1 Tax=Dryococelus australis TaxID=614101 RepID=A0ABQ9HNZ7_9NEOP|nr:hypothetical protein PR048_012290 [Dryococelus australis]
MPFIQKRRQQLGGSIIFWGGIMFGQRTQLIPIQGHMAGLVYRDNILQPVVTGFAATLGQSFTLVDDNACPYRARVVNQFLAKHGIQRMEWPTYTADMNCVEHAWSELKREIANRPTPPVKIQQLTDAAIQEWDALPQDKLDCLLLRMPHRVQACLQARDGYTRSWLLGSSSGIVIFLPDILGDIAAFTLKTEAALSSQHREADILSEEQQFPHDSAQLETKTTLQNSIPQMSNVPSEASGSMHNLVPVHEHVVKVAQASATSITPLHDRAGMSLFHTLGATVAERLADSPLTKANRVQSPAKSPDFCKWESCQTMLLVKRFSRGFPVSLAPSFRHHSIFTSITLISCQDLAVKAA